MTWNLTQEIGRKAIHMSIILVLAGFFILQRWYGKQAALTALTALFVIFLILEYFRLELGVKIPFFSQFIRPREDRRMYGVIFFLASTIIALSAFDVRIALTALLMTAFGDTAAALVGKRYGTTILFGNKTTIGFVAGLVTNLIVALGIVFLLPLMTPLEPLLIHIPIIMALTASLVETMVDEIDDALAIPMVSGLFGQLLLLL